MSSWALASASRSNYTQQRPRRVQAGEPFASAKAASGPIVLALGVDASDPFPAEIGDRRDDWLAGRGQEPFELHGPGLDT